MAYAIRKTGAGDFAVYAADMMIGKPYSTVAQAKRRARDLNRKGSAVQRPTTGQGKQKPMSKAVEALIPKTSATRALAKSSDAVKKSPAKKAAAPAKKAPTKPAPAKPAVSDATKTAALAGVDKVTEGKKPNKTEIAAIAKVVENGKKSDPKASTAVKAPEVKPAFCKAVPKSIDGKPVSNYRGVRLAIEAGGAEVGLAHGLALGLPASQVKAYVKELLVIIEKSKNKPAKGEKKATATKTAAAFEPHFRYPTYDKAKSFAIHQARRCGFAEANFHILSEGGKFAVAPISYKPPGEVPQFEKGDTVMDTIIKNSRGTITEAGPEQSIVEYDDKTRFGGKPQCIPNVYLYKLSSLEAAKVDSKPAKKKAKKG